MHYTGFYFGNQVIHIKKKKKKNFTIDHQSASNNPPEKVFNLLKTRV